MKNSGKPKKVSGKASRNRKHSVKRISEIMDDDNTTNSETSDQAVFSDINWEENLEVDTTSLLEEFAPQTLPKKSIKPPVKSSDPFVGSKSKSCEETASPSIELEMCDIDSPSDFHINLKLLILHYKTNQWVEAVVDEIDMDEEEVLVRYDGSCDNSEEWLSMKSQRIKKKKLQTPSQVIKLLEPSVPLQSTGSSDEVISSFKSNVHILPEVSTHSSSPLELPLPKKSKLTKKKNPMIKLRRSMKKPTYKKTAVLSNKTNSRRALQVQDRKTNRRLPVWKSHLQASSRGIVQDHSNSLVKVTGKFSEEEKVLAKWSEHRMQKFPAVIKKVCGGGYYDVLFYDGFEKTIVEDNIYKTTEEEVAKYKESKPSEADSFVDVDLASRHERREKKRKIFNDFFEEKDFKRTKKIESFDLNRSESFQRASISRNKPSLQSFSVHSKRNSAGSPKPSAAIVTPKSSPVATPPLVPEIKELDKIPQNSPGVVNEPPSISVEPVKTSPSLTISDQVEGKQNLNKKTVTSPQISPLQCPLEITCHDGVIRKSILIADEKLPSGWTKHVIAWVENAWACFLFTPDKYAVHSLIELKKYFRTSEDQDPPEGLDFSFSKDSLQDLMDNQKDLIPQSNYRKWVNKILDERKIMKKVRILPPSRTIGPGSHLSSKRVRTLLPKHRSHTLNQGASAKSLEGRVWRCPKSECAKKFRKENLLHMHIKHYHRELSELAESAPKVVDLALARTSADGTFTSEVPPKRPVSKSPMYDHTFDKHLDKSTSIQAALSEIVALESKPGSSIRPSTPQPGPSIFTSQTPPQGIASSLKVLTPVKQTKPKIEGDPVVIDMANEMSDKSQMHGTPKLSLKKHIESKASDDIAYLTGSRSLKKKQQPAERTVNTDLIINERNDLFTKDELRDDEGFDRLQSEEIINCLCGFKEEDGLMVQCEVCLCWQHGSCHGMEKDSDVPERYVCAICLNPLNVRSSQRYSYANHYLTLSKLPKFRFRTYNEETFQHRQNVLSRSFELSSNLQNICTMKRSLSAKINIAQHSDHPKLYLWSQNWDSSKKKQIQPYMKKTNTDSHGRRGPVGEAPIESVDCRLRLLDSIEKDQQDIESRLTIVQAQIQALESDDFEVEGEEEEGGGGGDDPLLKQAIYMLLRDLNTVATAAKLS